MRRCPPLGKRRFTQSKGRGSIPTSLAEALGAHVHEGQVHSLLGQRVDSSRTTSLPLDDPGRFFWIVSRNSVVLALGTVSSGGQALREGSRGEEGWLMRIDA